MEITRGPGPFTGVPGTTTRKSSGTSSSRQAQGVTEGAAQTEERDASRRIMDASRAARDAELQANNQIEAEREKYYQRSMAEMARQDAAYEAQRDKGTEILTDLKNQLQKEISRIRRDGEREIANLEAYYNATTRKLETEGRQKLDLENRLTQSQLEYDKRNAAEELDQTRETHRQQMQYSKSEFEQQSQALMDAQRAEYERLRESLSRLSEETEQSFNQKYHENKEHKEKQLAMVQSRAAEKIREIRADNSAKLHAYAQRQKDPFYRMMTLDTRFEEKEGEFVLTARIPPHEQKNISVTIKGNQLVLSGYRRNEEKLDLGEGRAQSSASYQSFSETFPLTYPVDGKQLSKKFEDDRLIVTLPKTAAFKARPQYEAKKNSGKPEPTRIEKPHFPASLSHVTDSHEKRHVAEGEEGAESSDPSPDDTNRGSRTLT